MTTKRYKKAKVVKQKKLVVDTDMQDRALIFTEDMMSRLFMPCILWGDTAYSVVKNTKPNKQDVYFVIKNSDLTKFAKSMLKTFVPDIKIGKNMISFDFEKLKVKIKVVQHYTRFLKNPDCVSYKYDTYLIPNPFDDYWKVRKLIS